MNDLYDLSTLHIIAFLRFKTLYVFLDEEKYKHYDLMLSGTDTEESIIITDPRKISDAVSEKHTSIIVNINKTVILESNHFTSALAASYLLIFVTNAVSYITTTQAYFRKLNLKYLQSREDLPPVIEEKAEKEKNKDTTSITNKKKRDELRDHFKKGLQSMMDQLQNVPYIPNIILSNHVGLDDNYAALVAHITYGYKTMILLHGLPGAGKSLWASKLLNDCYQNVKSNEFIFDSHDYWRNSNMRCDITYLEDAIAWNKQKCFFAIKNGTSPIIVDSINLEDEKEYCKTGLRFGYNVNIIKIKPWTTDFEDLALINTISLPRDKFYSMRESYRTIQDFTEQKAKNNSLRKYPPILENPKNENWNCCIL